MKQIKLPIASGLLLLFLTCNPQLKVAAQTTDSTATMEQEELNPVDQYNFHYLKKSKKDVLSAAKHLKENEIHDQAALAIDQVLQGKVAGLRAIGYSGAAGSGSLIRIRGNSTLLAGTTPLYIIDGIPVVSTRYDSNLSKYVDINPLADINIEDIETVTVLKDAHATSLYGARGANGVIIIKTTTGTSGKTYLDFNGFTGVQTMPENLSLLDANEYRAFIVEKEQAPTSAGGLGLNTSAILNKFPNSSFVLDPSHPNFEKFNNNTDWQNAVTETAIVTNANLKLKGGDALAKYAFNVGYTKQGGVVTDTKFERFNTRFNLDYKVSRKLRFFNSISYTRSDRKMQDEGNTYNTNPIFLSTIKAPFLAPYRQDREGLSLARIDSVDFLARSNPQGILNGINNKNNTNHILANLYAEYEFMPGLSARVSINGDYFRLRETRFTPAVGIQQVRNVIRYAAENNNVDLLLQNENTVSYNRTFNEVHSLNATIGSGLIYLDRSMKASRSINSASDEFVSISAGSAANIDSIGSVAPNLRLASFFTSLNYAFRDKYLLGLNFRADGSTRFGDNNRWAYFPAIAAGYRINNDFKLRTSYGISGNQDMGDYSSKGIVIAANSNNFPGSRLGTLTNPDLKWETTSQLNVGIDGGFLNNRLTFSTDFYVKKTSDLLNYVYLPGVSGFNSYLVNDGEVKNTGFEFAATGLILQGKTFGWSSDFNIAYNRNEVLSTPRNNDLVSTAYGEYQGLTRPGYAIGSFYGYKALGVYASDADVPAGLVNAFGTPFRGGDINFQDVNFDNIIDEKDKKVIGNSNPDVFGGFSNTFSYKSFDLNIFMDFSYGNQVYNALRARLESMSGYDNQAASVKNRWTETNRNTDMPRFAHGDPAGNNRFSSRWVEDASYTRLKVLTLGYNMPVGKTFKFINTARIYVTAQNLITFTDYKGYDPEVANISTGNMFAVDYGSVPQLRSFILGVRLGL